MKAKRSIVPWKGTTGIVLHIGHAYEGRVVDDHRPVKVKVEWTLRSGKTRDAWRYPHWTKYGFVFTSYHAGDSLERHVEQLLDPKYAEDAMRWAAAKLAKVNE